MAFNIHITHIYENPTASQMSSKMDNLKHKRTVTTKTASPALTLVSVPADNVINKYPVRIFNIES